MTLEQMLVKKILDRAFAYDWSLQGFGMLRLYLDDDTRIAVWDDRYAVPGVTEVHNHPWDFESHVISGRLHNRRFSEGERPEDVYVPREPTHIRHRILCGEGAHTVGDGHAVRLDPGPWELYEAGQGYTQRAKEIHQSRPERGTVTLITKLGSGDHADVYVPWGREWVDAEPRKATDTEVRDICWNALEMWSA